MNNGRTIYGSCIRRTAKPWRPIKPRAARALNTWSALRRMSGMTENAPSTTTSNSPRTPKRYSTAGSSEAWMLRNDSWNTPPTIASRMAIVQAYITPPLGSDPCIAPGGAPINTPHTSSSPTPIGNTANSMNRTCVFNMPVAAANGTSTPPHTIARTLASTVRNAPIIASAPATARGTG